MFLLLLHLLVPLQPTHVNSSAVCAAAAAAAAASSIISAAAGGGGAVNGSGAAAASTASASAVDSVQGLFCWLYPRRLVILLTLPLLLAALQRNLRRLQPGLILAFLCLFRSCQHSKKKVIVVIIMKQ
jgi:hypothetical protein